MAKGGLKRGGAGAGAGAGAHHGQEGRYSDAGAHQQDRAVPRVGDGGRAERPVYVDLDVLQHLGL